eukprot:CAMPEP_0172685866 /NCGR_PEP_ID=MMETSP1074-20121228/20543_1 /TAXON_ID=2916 /ORGANISM="Ceratium fusus, Strain PA161109" /LENGTH=231 /DNA_ID=CAMNT_0013505087 /DNA_START=90 /DNA_END=782 /DNA_ORIENTATION=+
MGGRSGVCRGGDCTEETDEPHFSGRWVTSKGNVHFIGLEAIQWSNGDMSDFASERRCGRRPTCSADVRGKRVTGELRPDDTLAWSDGDIWVREREKLKLEQERCLHTLAMPLLSMWTSTLTVGLRAAKLAGPAVVESAACRLPCRTHTLTSQHELATLALTEIMHSRCLRGTVPQHVNLHHLGHKPRLGFSCTACHGLDVSRDCSKTALEKLSLQLMPMFTYLWAMSRECR